MKNNVLDSEQQNSYWTTRYQEAKTGWDIGYPSTPLKTYFDQIKNKSLSILLPGAGNAYEAEYLHAQGFEQVFVLDISQYPLQQFIDRVPTFPERNLIHENFFYHIGKYDLIIEQTFFCSFLPTKEYRSAYAEKMHSLLKAEGRLVGVWFDIPLVEGQEKRPFGGSRSEYLTYFSPLFKIHTFEACHNSIQPRAGNELFGILEKKSIS